MTEKELLAQANQLKADKSRFGGPKDTIHVEGDNLKYGVVVKHRINELARMFYSLEGYVVEPGYDFSKATHPHEKLCWLQAEMSFKFWNKH